MSTARAVVQIVCVSRRGGRLQNLSFSFGEEIALELEGRRRTIIARVQGDMPSTANSFQ